MSLKASKWARVQRIHATPKAVLAYLAECANEKQGYYCFPGQKTIAQNTGLSERTVRLALSYLEDMGFIERERRQRNGDRLRSSDGITVLVSDDEVVIQPYGEWYKQRATYRQVPQGYRQEMQGLPAAPAGQEREEKLEVGTSRDSRDSSTQSAREANDLAIVLATEEIITGLPSQDDRVIEGLNFRVASMESLPGEEGSLLRQASERYCLALSQEVQKRFGVSRGGNS